MPTKQLTVTAEQINAVVSSRITITSLTFTGIFNLNVEESYYTQYSLTTNLQLSEGVSSVIGNFDRVVIVADGTHTPVPGAGWVLRPGSDSFNIITGKLNEYIVTKFPEGIEYMIKVMN